MTARQKATVCCVGPRSAIPFSIPESEIEKLKAGFGHVRSSERGFMQTVINLDILIGPPPRKGERADDPFYQAVMKLLTFPRARPLVVPLGRHDADSEPLALYISTKPFVIVANRLVTVSEPAALGTVIFRLESGERGELEKKMPARYMVGLAEALQGT
jgi:hypothetical protein